MNIQGKTVNFYKGNWKNIKDGETVILIIDDSKGVIKSEKDGTVITVDEFDSENYVGGPAMLFFKNMKYIIRFADEKRLSFGELKYPFINEETHKLDDKWTEWFERV